MKKNIKKALIILEIVLLIIYVLVMIYEIANFSPYNKGMFLWLDRALEFLLPSMMCFLISNLIKTDK